MSSLFKRSFSDFFRLFLDFFINWIVFFSWIRIITIFLIFLSRVGIIFNNFLLNLSFKMSIFIWKRLHENTWLWFLVAKIIFYLKLNPRKRDRNTKMSFFFLRRIRYFSLIIFRFFLLILNSYDTICNKSILLMKKRNFGFDDFTSL